MDDYLRGLRFRAQPTLKYSKVSHGIRVWLLLRRYLDHFQACLSCRFGGSNKAITIFLNEVEEGHFLRRTGGIYEVECDKLKDKEWFMKEAFVSYPRNDPTEGSFRIMVVGVGRRLYVIDEQVIGSGFERISFSSGFPTDVNITGIPTTPSTALFLGALASFHDLSTKRMPLTWGEIGAGISAIVYFNKNTMSLFAMIIKPTDFYGARIAIIEPSTLEFHPTYVTTGITSKTLASGWHVFLHSSTSREDISYLHLSVQPVNPLETFM